MRGCPPPHNQCQSGDDYGGVDHSQGVQTSFYESTPSAQDPLGNTSSQWFTEDSQNARATERPRWRSSLSHAHHKLCA